MVRIVNGFEIKTGAIVLVAFDGVTGSVQSGTRPAIVVQNNVGNHYSPTTIVVPLTSVMKKKMKCTHVFIDPKCGVKEPSLALCEQPQTIDKKSIIRVLGCIKDDEIQQQIKKKLAYSFGISVPASA